MMTVFKVREDLAPNDYRDPGPYKFPAGTVAYEVDASAAGEPARQPSGTPGMEMRGMEMPGMKMPSMKHGGHQGHH